MFHHYPIGQQTVRFRLIVPLTMALLLIPAVFVSVCDAEDEPVPGFNPIIREVFTAGNATGKPAGYLERKHESALAEQIHDQHQYGNELSDSLAAPSKRLCML